MENNPMPQQQRVLRKIRKIKRPKTAMPPMQQPSAPLKAGFPPQGQLEQSPMKRPAVAPRIDFGPAPQPQNRGEQVRNLPQSEIYKQDALYNQNGGAENIRFVSEDYPSGVLKANDIKELLKNKTILLLMALSGILGLFIGATSFSSSENSKNGLDWVVTNPDVPGGRSRCGLVDTRQGCVLYVMNPEKRNVTGKDFYSVAAKWTKRERFQIETGNMHYGSKQIKPGHIAQINIPPL